MCTINGMTFRAPTCIWFVTIHSDTSDNEDNSFRNLIR